MARRNELVFALNAGGVDKDALSRIDLEKLRLAGEHPVLNWRPKVLGPMGIRPGLESVAGLSAVTRLVPFVRDSATSALLAMSDQTLMIYDSEGAPVQVVNSATAITNPTFTSGGGGWTDVSETGDGTAGVATLGLIGGVAFVATRWRAAAIQQSVSVAGGDQATVHTLRITVSRGPVFFRVGSTSGAENIFTETRLLTGTHKISFTPNAGTIYIRFRSDDRVVRTLADCRFEHTALGGAGNLTLPTPWLEPDLPFLSWDQSADVLFIADGTYQQRRIERRGPTSWSIVLYQTRGGPLRAPESDKITITPSAYTGNGTLTANVPYFKASHVGTLFELTHNEQRAIDQLHAADQITDQITVRGLFSGTITFDDRNFGYNLLFSGGAVMTVALERSTDVNAEVWTKVEEFTGTAAATYNDEQSNLLCHYRLRCTAYTSGYADVSLVYLAGATTGLARVTEFTSSTVVNFETVSTIGGTGPTRQWRGPAWSDDLGWPRVPRFRDGRLHWFLGDTDYASVVDDFDNYDDTIEGDSAPFVRTVGSGAAEGVRWALDMDKLSIGTSGYVASVQASDLGEVLTPTNFGVRRGPSVGASFVPPVQIDDRAIMADKTNRRLYDIGSLDGTAKLKAEDASRLNPSAVQPGIAAMGVQRQPDTHVYIVLDDGTSAVLTYERDDKVVAFTSLTTPSGTIEDVCVIPGPTEDVVYFIVLRFGATRYIERLALEADQRSVSTCILLDAAKELTGSISSITGGTHLASREVQVWADGVRRAPVTLNGSGVAALGATYSRVVYGLAYDAVFKSVKLAYAAQLGTALGQTKRVSHAGLILSKSTLDGIEVGKDEANVAPLPDYYEGALRTTSQFVDHYDMDLMPIYSDWTADARIYVVADSSYGPKTVQSIVLDVETREGATNRNG